MAKASLTIPGRKGVMPLLSFLVLALSVQGIAGAPGYAHVAGRVTKTLGNVRVQFTTQPATPLPDEPIALLFSMQDLNGNNIQDVVAAVRIGRADQALFATPPTRYEVGDFQVSYRFPAEGDYTVSLDWLGRETLTVEFTVTVWRDLLTAFVIGNPMLVILLIGMAAMGAGSILGRLRNRTESRTEFIQAVRP